MTVISAVASDGARVSPPVINREIAFAGKQVKQKITLGLILALALPILVLGYGVYAYVMPLTASVKGTVDLRPLLALLTFTGLLMLGGSIVVWDVATAVSRAARVISSAGRIDPEAIPHRDDDIGALLESFARMTATIEQQAEELRRVPARLDELARQAFRDSLTNLANRALFMDRLAHALVRTERRADDVAVLFLDLDRFKVVNDSLGHAVGDQVLIEVGRRLKDSVRPEDTVARLGGDEFGIMLEGLVGVAGAKQVAERIIEQLDRPFIVGGREVFVTGSIGIALSPSPQTAPEQLLRYADLAMYQAKNRGDARYAVHDGNTNAPALERLDLEMDLRAAMARNEFALHYQPIIDLDTNRVVALEALIRWAHPRRGLLLPADFIALTEETGLIVPIGQWVLGEACRQLRDWERLAPTDVPLAMAVNLSAKQVHQATVLNEVTDALRASGLPPERLVLEITESAMMDDDRTVLDRLRALRGVGVRLALDDFGKGYSALNRLKRVPADVLKIDQSFVDGIDDRPEDTEIVRAVIAVAKSLRLRVVAEGIETEEQAARLRAMGCDYGQGFFFARPLAPEHIPALLSNPRWRVPSPSRVRSASHLRRA
ncbi:MAG TPA: EAL domain-containing protein [Candidatus Methylomirabilis sp.]|nr:EAL domain-containing protein [Candidatus Methylomirabilis sp.]